MNRIRSVSTNGLSEMRGNGKRESLIQNVVAGAILAAGTAVPSYAAITNAGENIGTLIQEQGYPIALAIVVVALIKFLLKKAWVPAVAFGIVGGILLFVISYPDALKTTGQALYNVIVK